MRATKLLPQIKHLHYQEWLTALDLPILKYRRLWGDMIEMYKIITDKQDSEVTINSTLFQLQQLERIHIKYVKIM